MNKVCVKGQRIYFYKAPEPIPKTQVNFSYIEFNLDDIWEGFSSIVAQFSQGDVIRNVKVLDHKAFVPSEFQVGPLELCLRGDDGNTIVASVNRLPLKICESFNSGGEEPIPPSQDLYSQLVAEIEKGIEVAQSVREDADSGKFDGKQGEQGVQGVPGKAATVTVGEVTTLDPESPATVQNRGTENEAIFIFGIPQGQPGKDGTQLEDDAVTSTAAWSSKKIVDALCPAFTVEGNPVTCNPVENYPLNVKATFSPKQEGTGDPSPENIRPISGWDKVQVTRCGNNYIDFDNLNIVNGSYDQSTGAFTEGGLIEATEKLLAIPSSKAINLNSSGANARVFFLGK